MGEQAPQAPKYNPPPGYVNPGAFQPAGVAKTLTGMGAADQGNAIMGQGPAWLNLNQYNGSAPGQMGGPFDQALMQKMSNWYMQNEVQPQVSQAQSQMQNSGQNYGSYGPAFAGQLTGEGQQQAFQAALAANQQQFGDVIAGNNAYYQGPTALAANQANFQTNQQNQMNEANMQFGNQYNLQNAENQNNYDLSATGMGNNFDLNNYANQFEHNQYDNALDSGGLSSYGISNNDNLLGSPLV